MRMLPVIVHGVFPGLLRRRFGGDAVKAGEIHEPDIATLLSAAVHQLHEVLFPLIHGLGLVLPIRQFR